MITLLDRESFTIGLEFSWYNWLIGVSGDAFTSPPRVYQVMLGLGPVALTFLSHRK